MKIIFLLLIFSFIFISKNTFSKNVFESKEYILDFNSTFLNDTKQLKINEIKVISFIQILEKILLDVDYNNIKRTIDSKFSDKFIKNILINDEKIINENYYAKIKVNFNKNLILEHLTNNKINYVDFLPENFLTIIFEQNETNENLLSTQNFYYDFLKNSENELLNFYLLPNLDINDRYLVSKNDIINQKLVNFNKLIKKYNNENLVVIHAINNKENTIIKNYINYKNSLHLIDNIKVNNNKLDLFFLNLKHKILNKWKSYNLIVTSKISSIKCNIKTLNVYELKKIKSLILVNSIVNDFNLINISLNSNTYLINYFGEKDILIKSLNRMNIKLVFENEICKLRLL